MNFSDLYEETPDLRLRKAMPQFACKLLQVSRKLAKSKYGITSPEVMQERVLMQLLEDVDESSVETLLDTLTTIEDCIEED